MLLQVVFGCLTLAYVARSEDVFASSAHMRIVATGERKMMRALDKYIHMEQDRLGNISR